MTAAADVAEPIVKKKKKAKAAYLGIDGEGIGREPHRYVLLAVSDETGDKRYHIENPDGLSTYDCLLFIANLPVSKTTRLFAYSFGYDLTKILQGLPDELLYRLFRPELRSRNAIPGSVESMLGPEPVLWQGFELNLQGSKFILKYRDVTVILWDIWKFYQGKFITALSDWKVGSAENLAETERMKELRSKFKPEDMPEIREYCFGECRDMAQLAHKLVDAHTEAGLKLTSFYGAGSTASAMLKLMKIKEALKPTLPEMRHAVACSFFGGRFENSVVGEINEPVKNWDISSAYPYQTCFLPCLLHGTWRRTTRRKDIEKARTACVEYSLIKPKGARDIEHWAPFPFRGADGSICFPSESGGGWVWKEEYLAGERFVEAKNPGAVRFKSAWVYECECSCQPFASIPHYYRERCRIGKEGAGIVFKLGPNRFRLREIGSKRRFRHVPVVDMGRDDHVRLSGAATRPDHAA